MEEWIAASTPQRIESAPTLILTVEQFDEVSVRARFNFFDYNSFFFQVDPLFFKSVVCSVTATRRANEQEVPILLPLYLSVGFPVARASVSTKIRDPHCLL